MPESLFRAGTWKSKLPNFCNLSNQTAIFSFRLQSQQSDCNLSNRTAISAIRLQSQQSDCNLSNWTAISAIRLQSQQSDCNLCNQSKTPRNMPDTLCRVGAPYVSCGIFAIPAIGLQSQQSDCNLSNQTAISAIRLQSSYIAVWLCRLQFDCGDCSLTPGGGLGHVYVSWGTFAI